MDARARTQQPSLASLSTDPMVRADPYPLYAWFREHHPVLETPETVILSRFADIKAVLADPRFGVTFTLDEEGSFTRQRGGLDTPAAQQWGRFMLFKDPPDHTRLRRLIAKAFARRSLEAIRPQIHAITDRLLDQAAARGGMDAVADFALPLPIAVICALVGIPLEEAERFRRWVDDTARFLDVQHTPESIARMNMAHMELIACIEDFVERRRQHLGDDLISELIRTEEQGDRLTKDEVVAMVDMLFQAGHESPANLIGIAILTLLRHPEQTALLRADPALMPRAIEEILRYDSPVQIGGRRALEDTEIADVRVPAGMRATFLVGAAHRDPARFSDPDRFDIRREDGEVLSFGGGIHFCIGATLARMETEIALATLMQRFSRIALATEDLVWRPHALQRGLEALPITVG